MASSPSFIDTAAAARIRAGDARPAQAHNRGESPAANPRRLYTLFRLLTHQLVRPPQALALLRMMTVGVPEE